MTRSFALSALGFDPPRLGYTLRTAIAACIAIGLAWLLGFEHPQWSGMTVWAASQPLRGSLLEKSVFRILGTILGALYGIGLLVLFEEPSWPMVLGLCAWLACCAAIGNLLRGFASYGAILAGYSAAMVALLHSAASASPFAVGLDRMATVLLGVAVALAIGWAFAAPGNLDDPVQRVRRLAGRMLGALADHLAGASRTGGHEQQRLLSEIASIEDALDGYAAGSRRARMIVRDVRQMLLAQVALLLWMRRSLNTETAPSSIAALRRAADACNEPSQAAHVDAALAATLGTVADEGLRDVLTGLAVALRSGRQEKRGRQDIRDVLRPVPLHRDWVGAAQAWARAGFVTFAVGAIWLATGWEAGAFMLLGVCIMMTIFSTVENPAATLRQVVLGQALGIFGALCCRWLVWPLAHGEGGLILSMMPFVLAGGILFGHRSASGPIGFDYNMVLLLMLQPHWPLTGSFAQSLELSAAVVLGPVIAIAAYLSIYPVTGERKLRRLLAMMVREIEAMATRRGSARRSAVWRARLFHRVLRLVWWADKSGRDRNETIEGALTLLLLGSATLHLDSIRSGTDLPAGSARPLDTALARLGDVGKRPERAAMALDAIARRFAANPLVDRVLLHEAATQLAARATFIRTNGH